MESATARPQHRCAPATTFLSIADVAVARAGRPVVEGATFDVPPGSAVILKGPNGSGKTTLLRAIAGLAPIQSGRINVSIGGTSFHSMADRRARTVLCGHADSIKSAMSAEENLAFWARLYGAPATRLDDAVDAFDIGGFWRLRAASLSAGQRRRVALSRLVLSGKRVWLLDEPTSSVDAASAARLNVVLRKHLDEGGLAIIATHDKLAVDGARTFMLEARAAQ